MIDVPKNRLECKNQ